MGRKKSEHDAKRIEIAKALCEVILESGLEGARMKEVAARIGYTTGVIQHYFNDKEEMLLFAKNYLFDKTFSRMEAAAEKETGIARLFALSRELLPLTKRQLEMYQLLIAFRGRAIGNPDLMRFQQERDQVGWQIFIEEIAALQNQGLIDKTLNPLDQGIALNAFVEGLAIQLAMQPSKMKKETQLALLRQYIEAVFGRLDRNTSTQDRGALQRP